MAEPPVERRQGERRREERERIRLFEQRIAAEQDERRRLALQLHDGAVQALAGIALMLDAVDHAIADGRYDDARTVLAGALTQQRKTIQSLRDLSFNIEPVTLRDHGFESAVRALGEQVIRERGVRFELDAGPAESLAERAQVTFYQIIREAIDQAGARGPTRISVTVANTPEGDVAVTIADDGRAERRDVAEAFEERSRPLSGAVKVDRTEAGTTVRIVLPEYVARR